MLAAEDSYPTLNALEQGLPVQVDGMLLKKAEGPIGVGDFYVGERNTGPHLLIARLVRPIGQGGYVVPESNHYAYNIWECVKVEEA